MKTHTLITQCVDSCAPPSHAALARTVEQQRALSALLRQAYAHAAPEPPQLAFLAQRVIARAKAQPQPPLARAWSAVRAFFGLHPLWAWSSASAAAALAFALAALPLVQRTSAAPAPVRSFVIYQLPSGGGFIRMLEYEQTSNEETSNDQS